MPSLLLMPLPLTLFLSLFLPPGQLEKFMGAEKTRRRHRVLGELSTVVRGSAHLVLPAIAKFWRMELSSQKLEEVVVDTKVHYT